MLQAVARTQSLPLDISASRPERTRAVGGSSSRLFAFIRRQAFLVAGVTALALTIGLSYEVLSPLRYLSSAELLIDPQGAPAAPADIARAGGRSEGSRTDIDGRRYVILSRPVLEAAVRQGHLDENPLFGAPGSLEAELTSALHPGGAATDRIERAVTALAAAVDVERGNRPDALDIGVTTADPVVSATIANTLAHVYLDHEAAAPTGGVVQTSRVDALRQEVEQADAAVAAFRARNNLPAGTPAQSLGDRQLIDLTYQLAMARVRTADAQAKVTQIDQAGRAKVDPAKLPEALTSPVVESLRNQYARLVQQEGSLSAEVGPRYPALIQLQEQIRQVRGQIAAEIDRIVQATRAELSRAKANEAALQHSIDQLGRGNGADPAVLTHRSYRS